MNKNEFTQLQKEIGQTVVSYERFCKKGYLLDLRYTAKFREYIEKEHRLSNENELLKQALLRLKGENPEETERFITEFKTQYAKNAVRLANKIRQSEQTASAETAEASSEMEQAFEAYAMTCHPAVRIYTSKEERAIYNQLRALYMDNRLSAFTALLEMNRSLLQTQELPEEKYIPAAEYYYRTMEQIRLDVRKKQKGFPYTKEVVLADALTLAAEEAEFRVRLNQLTGLNKSLHRDIMTLYGKDIAL